MVKTNEGVIPPKYEKFVLALLFAAIFSSVGWMVPALYLQTSPPAEHVQINSVSVNETSNTTHNVTVDYHSRDRYPVDAQITLFRQHNGSSTAVEYWRTSVILPQGSGTSNLNLDLQNQPEEGLYYYAFDVDMMVGYNVQKTYEYKTDTFTITNGTTNSTQEDRRTPVEV